MWLLAKLFSAAGAGFIVKLFRGIAGPILQHYQAKDKQTTDRQGIWAKALVGAAHADVENRKTAAAERASNPILMGIYIMIMFPPALYWFLFWMDTIFSGQTWTIFGWTIMDWATWNLPSAPKRLEAMGQEVLIVFIGGTSAVYGVVKGAKVLGAAGIFKGK